MTDDKYLLLRLHGCIDGLSEQAGREISDATELVRFEAGDQVHVANQIVTAFILVIHGRLRQSIVDIHGNVIFNNELTPGNQFGALAAAAGEPSPVACVADEPTTVLRLNYQTAIELGNRHDMFRLNMARLMAGSVKRVLFRDRERRCPSLVALIHASPETQPLTRRLIERLLQLGERPCVVTDRSDWRPIDGVPSASVYENGQQKDEYSIRKQLSEWSEHKRIFFDVSTGLDPGKLRDLIGAVECVLWCVTPDSQKESAGLLGELVGHSPAWREKINLVWALDGEHSAAPLWPNLAATARRDFKLSLASPPPGRALAAGFERLVHHLRGVKIGVALGGGAARGMAHLGVLKALHDSGIAVDMIAGTSAGAMTGTTFASGIDVDYLISRFVADLRPSWFFRLLPHGEQWYLLYKYRRGQFDPMLRKYLKNWQLEQLPIPMNSITVDLVSGQAVVRDSGDAVHGIIESINLPVLSAPICRNGQALVDGGLINNVPADVLVSRGCNFVIAVSVTARMEKEFVSNRPDTPTEKMKKASTLQTVLRSYLVQSTNMNSVGVQPADIVIEPDLTKFELTAFTRTDELAAVGHQVTLEAIPKIRDLLSKLDNRLFPA